MGSAHILILIWKNQADEWLCHTVLFKVWVHGPTGEVFWSRRFEDFASAAAADGWLTEPSLGQAQF